MTSEFINLTCNDDVHVNNVGFDILVGEVIMWPHATNIPSGFLQCDGSTYNISTYSELYSVIGNLYGSNLPNLNSGTDLLLGNSNMSNNSTTLTAVSSNNPITGGDNTINSNVISDHSHTISFNSNSLGYNYKSSYDINDESGLEFNMVKGNFGDSGGGDQNGGTEGSYDDGGNSKLTAASRVHNHDAYYNTSTSVTTVTRLNATFTLPTSTNANYTIADYNSGSTQTDYNPLKFHVYFIIYAGTT